MTADFQALFQIFRQNFREKSKNEYEIAGSVIVGAAELATAVIGRDIWRGWKPLC
jgi:hypothetical protein